MSFQQQQNQGQFHPLNSAFSSWNTNPHVPTALAPASSSFHVQNYIGSNNSSSQQQQQYVPEAGEETQGPLNQTTAIPCSSNIPSSSNNHQIQQQPEKQKQTVVRSAKGKSSAASSSSTSSNSSSTSTSSKREKKSNSKYSVGDHTLEVKRRRGKSRGVGLKIQTYGHQGSCMFKFHKDNRQHTFRVLRAADPSKIYGNELHCSLTPEISAEVLEQTKGFTSGATASLVHMPQQQHQQLQQQNHINNNNFLYQSQLQHQVEHQQTQHQFQVQQQEYHSPIQQVVQFQPQQQSPPEHIRHHNQLHYPPLLPSVSYSTPTHNGFHGQEKQYANPATTTTANRTFQLPSIKELLNSTL